MKLCRRFLSVLLVCCLLVSLVPTMAMATDKDFVIENGVLTEYQGPGGDVVIPSSVTSIGGYAFCDCNSLTSITIPDSVTSIGERAFYGCNGLTSVEIPDSVTSIGESTFRECSSLTNVTIPDSVTSIGERAFYGCSGLTSVEIPDSVTSIGEYAFYGCSGLTSVEIPISVAGIGRYAFYGCNGLKKVAVLGSKTSIGRQAFDGCVGLISAGPIGGGYDYEFACTDGCPSFEYYTNIKSVTVPDGVTYIGQAAFNSCEGLTDITLPASLTSVGYRAFNGCYKLSKVLFRGSEEAKDKISIDMYENYYLTDATWQCGVVDIVSISAGSCEHGEIIIPYYRVEKGGTVQFALRADDGYKVKAIYLNNVAISTASFIAYNNSVITAEFELIRNEQFIDSGSCGSGVKWVLYEDGELYIYGNGNMTNFNNESRWSPHVPWNRYVKDITNVVIAEGVTSIGDEAFYECSNLVSITIPSTINRIGGGAFANCNAVEAVFISDVAKWCEIAFVSSYGRYLSNPFCSVPGDKQGYIYLNGDLLTDLVIPEGVTKINNGVFYDCTQLISVSIPNSVTEIGKDAFSGCAGINRISLPDSITTIGDYAFCMCGMESISIPSLISTVGEGVFKSCAHLKLVSVPKNVTQINASAFSGCGALSDVYYGGAECDWDAIVVGDDNEPLQSATIHYHDQEIDKHASVYFLNGYDPTYRRLTFGDSGLVTPYVYTLAEGVDDLTLGQLIDQYVLVTSETSEDSILAHTVTAVQPVESKIGVLSAIDDTSMTIDGHTYPSSEMATLIWGQYEGVEVLYHVYNGEIKALSPLEEKHGVISAWDSSTGRVAIDGMEYPTNFLTDMSSFSKIDQYFDNKIVYYTSGDLNYTPLIKIGGFYYPDDPNNFNADIYHATWLSKHGNDADHLIDQTPSDILIETSGSIAVDLWRSFELVFGTLDDITTLHDFAAKPKDVYSALILNALEASVSYDLIASEVEDGLKLSKQIVGDVSTVIKAEKGIDLNNSEQFLQYITDDPNDIQKYIKNWFNNEQQDLASMNIVLKSFSMVTKAVSTLEDYAEYCAACYALTQVSDSMQEVLERAYEKSKSGYGPSDNLTLAFKECLEIITDGSDDLYKQIEKGSIKIIGKNAGKYIIGNLLWSKVTDRIKTSCPEIAILQVGYKAGKTISNWLCNTDDAVEKYLKMDYITDIENLVNSIYWDLEFDFDKNPSQELALTYLSGMELSFALRDVDSECAYKYVDNIQSSIFGSLKEYFGAEDYKGLKNAINDRREQYKDYYESAQTNWVDSLLDDYPGSGLYEKYDSLLRGTGSSGPAKEVVAACPVNVYVYDNTGSVVASVIDGRVSCSADDVMVALIEDQKTIRLYDGADYRIECVGYATGDMDITVSEFDASENIIRTVNYYDMAVDEGTGYSINVDDQILATYQLIDKRQNVAVAYDYDSMEIATGHTIKMVSGTLQKDGELFAQTEAKKGESIEINAYIPEGSEFVRWESSSSDMIILDINNASTTVIMPDTDVTLTAILKETDETTSDDPETPAPTPSDADDSTPSAPSRSSGTTGSSKAADTSATSLEPEPTPMVKEPLPFTDVAKNAWYADAVRFVTESRLMNGYGDGKFGPEDVLGRAQLAQILYNREGRPTSPNGSGFPDVANGTWYINAITWAASQKIINGFEDGTFRPEISITREQLAVMLWRYAGSPAADAELDFVDADKASSYAVDALKWAVENGVIHGKGNEILDPEGQTTRAEAAQMLKNYFDK